MQKQILTMLEMQEQINERIHPQWRSQNFNWRRAVVIETSEMIDHYGWKWWKKQEPNIEQVKLELVDIWHFLLGSILSKGKSLFNDSDSLESKAKYIEQYFTKYYPEKKYDFLISADRLHYCSSESNDLRLEPFIHCLNNIGMSFDDLYTSYISKNVLNFFRQDNGYNTGEYNKIWNGKEDNEHLVEIVSTLDSSNHNFKDLLLQELEKRYSNLIPTTSS